MSASSTAVSRGPLMKGAVTARDVVATNIGSARYIVGAAVAPNTIENLDALAVQRSSPRRLRARRATTINPQK